MPNTFTANDASKSNTHTLASIIIIIISFIYVASFQCSKTLYKGDNHRQRVIKTVIED